MNRLGENMEAMGGGTRFDIQTSHTAWKHYSAWMGFTCPIGVRTFSYMGLDMAWQLGCNCKSIDSSRAGSCLALVVVSTWSQILEGEGFQGTHLVWGLSGLPLLPSGRGDHIKVVILV